MREAIESIEANLGAPDMKPTLADLVRLVQIVKDIDIDTDDPGEFRVRWIESGMVESGRKT